ncbi:NAD(P)-binding protein [Phlebopus sp. FC_14]|nr:NAD(P)-binding protein [Phlebopus sp. FC_14]
MNNPTDPAVLFGVEGLVAVVTGGGTGIGLMIATALESNGATVYVIGRRLDVLERAAAEHNKFGRIIPLQADVTSRESLLTVVQSIKARHGYIDLLVNNAGIARNLLPPHLPSPLDDADATGSTVPSIKSFQDVLWNTGGPTGFAETFETNLTAVYYTTVAFLELLHLGNLRRGSLPPLFAAKSLSTEKPKARRETNMDIDKGSSQSSPSSTPPGAYYSIPPTPPASNSPLPPDVCLPAASPTNALSGIPLPTSQVITVSSSGAFRVDARVLSVSYTLAKHANMHLGKLLANLLADWNIRSNVLCPGVWPSEMTRMEHLTPSLLAQTVPLGRPGTLSDMAGPILFLAGRAGAYVNGAVWLVDGGRVGTVASSY